MLACSFTTSGALTMLEEPKFPVGLCTAVIFVDPPESKVNDVPETVAIDESATPKVQVPEELDVGGCKVMVLLEVDPKVTVIGSREPTVGTRGRKERFIEVVAEEYPFAGD